MALGCAALAAYRLAVLLAEEEGPFACAARVRSLYTVDDWIGRGMRCPACLAFWLALPLTAVALASDATLPVALWPLYWLAVAGAARWLWRMEP